MRPFFSYFGAKYLSAMNYPPPAYQRLIEPFAGAAGYATRWHTHDVVLVEKNPVVAGLWRYLIGASRADVLALPLIEPGQKVADLSVPAGADALIGFWCASGRGEPALGPTTWMRSREWGDHFWGEKIRARCANQVEAIKHWTVIEGDYSQAPDVEATWFIDPPYQVAGARHYKFGARQLDFEALARWAPQRRGQVMVCENLGATWLPFRPHATIRGMKGTKRTGQSHEAIWTNWQSDLLEGV